MRGYSNLSAHTGVAVAIGWRYLARLATSIDRLQNKNELRVSAALADAETRLD